MKKTVIMMLFALFLFAMSGIFMAYTHWVLFHACSMVDPVPEAPKETVKERV